MYITNAYNKCTQQLYVVNALRNSHNNCTYREHMSERAYE